MTRDVLDGTGQIMSVRSFKINRDFPLTQGGDTILPDHKSAHHRRQIVRLQDQGFSILDLSCLCEFPNCGENE